MKASLAIALDKATMPVAVWLLQNVATSRARVRETQRCEKRLNPFSYQPLHFRQVGTRSHLAVPLDRHRISLCPIKEMVLLHPLCHDHAAHLHLHGGIIQSKPSMAPSCRRVAARQFVNSLAISTHACLSDDPILTYLLVWYVAVFMPSQHDNVHAD